VHFRIVKLQEEKEHLRMFNRCNGEVVYTKQQAFSMSTEGLFSIILHIFHNSQFFLVFGAVIKSFCEVVH
jgi:hypothetical protein